MKLNQNIKRIAIAGASALCLSMISASASAEHPRGHHCESEDVVHHHHHHYYGQPQHQPSYKSGYYQAPPPRATYGYSPGTYAPRGSYASHGYTRSPNFGNAVGGALGGFVGSKIGKGSGRLAATAAGSVLGYMLGGQAQLHYR